jgi:hypothetical protein
MLCAQQRLNEAPMTADPDRLPMFRLLDPQGVEIAKGSMSAVSELILDSKSRKAAEALLRDAAVAVGTIDSINSRADAVIERERQIAAAERRLQADRVQALVDSIDDLATRLDAHEQARIADELARLPDPDDPRSHSDDLEAVHEPSHDFDKEVLEATLEREADDADGGPGDLPPELDLPAQSGNFVAPEDPLGAGTRAVSTVPSADARRFKEPKPRKGRDWPAQPISVSLTSQE